MIHEGLKCAMLVHLDRSILLVSSLRFNLFARIYLTRPDDHLQLHLP